MTPEEQHARSARYGERVRYEERNRAFDMIEMAALDEKTTPETAAILWDLAVRIVSHKP